MLNHACLATPHLIKDSELLPRRAEIVEWMPGPEDVDTNTEARQTRATPHQRRARIPGRPCFRAVRVYEASRALLSAPRAP
eukprot:CAMPEP_0113666662 /NCGR_PEP_ID=MMETSP0038_2-20120614/3003_1 /TAXON_ID=2898 /ORGANISM="Cryptomonas paramecium" /LENGTH=80 /DNA_ID=CAMNT_0000582187 /DNA_START=359 /DNA_END=598 /DNA_ORIENTATION=+ /assembly_acc=CAM_ASM_000170